MREVGQEGLLKRRRERREAVMVMRGKGGWVEGEGRVNSREGEVFKTWLLGLLLGLSWLILSLLGPLLAHLGASWASLGSSWGPLGAKEGPKEGQGSQQEAQEGPR